MAFLSIMTGSKDRIMPNEPSYLAWEGKPKRQSSNKPTTADPLVGQVFGSFTVELRTWRGQRARYYQCHCRECNNPHILNGADLKKGKIKTCADDYIQSVAPRSAPKSQKEKPIMPASSLEIPFDEWYVMHCRMVENLNNRKTAEIVGLPREKAANIYMKYRHVDADYWK